MAHEGDLKAGTEPRASPLSCGRIYLVGFMGSGKTTLGQLLADRLGVPFVDLDLAFEAMSGKTIRETFEIRGERWFRERETELLRGTEALPAAVIALGGGTFVAPENAAFIRRSGISVFLDVPFAVLASRLSGKTADRPRFKSLEDARILYEARLPCYKMADRTIPVNEGEGVNAVVERLCSALTSSSTGEGR